MRKYSSIFSGMALASVVALGLFATPAQARVGVILNFGPPAPPYEVVPAPRPGYEWAPGYYDWRDGQYVWIPGFWMAGRPGYHWMGGGWVQRGGHWNFDRGHWGRG